jgi:hypothetical protein
MKDAPSLRVMNVYWHEGNREPLKVFSVRWKSTDFCEVFHKKEELLATHPYFANRKELQNDQKS